MMSSRSRAFCPVPQIVWRPRVAIGVAIAIPICSEACSGQNPLVAVRSQAIVTLFVALVASRGTLRRPEPRRVGPPHFFAFAAGLLRRSRAAPASPTAQRAWGPLALQGIVLPEWRTRGVSRLFLFLLYRSFITVQETVTVTRPQDGDQSQPRLAIGKGHSVNSNRAHQTRWCTVK
jgi:hypothetical protein